MATNAALMPVTPEMLASLFDLPADHTIVGVFWEDRRWCAMFRLEGPTLPPCAEGQTPVEILPTYRKKDYELLALNSEETP